MSRPDGLIEFPDGSAIYYDDPSHAYYRAVPQAVDESGFVHEWRRGKRLTGASTLCKVFDWDPGNLLRWKERVTCEAIADLLGQSWQTEIPDWASDGPTILDRLKTAKASADDQRDRAGEVGTNIHRVLEGLAGVGEPVEIEGLPVGRGYATAVHDWWNERNPTVLNAEQFVYSETHGYAGRFDLRCEIDGSKREGFPLRSTYLVDLKTGWVGNGAHIQMQLYSMAAMECGVGACDELLILQVKDDGTWKEIPVRATEADALAAIAVYRGAGRMNRKVA